MTLTQVKMGELLKVDGGFAFKSKDFSESGSPIVRISNISQDTVNLDDAAQIPEDKVRNGEKFRLSPGDILMAMSGATTGKLGILPETGNNHVYLNQRVGRFSPSDGEKLDKKYLWFFLKSEICQQQIKVLAEGAAQPNVSASELESIKIPLQPIAEQKRIAAILDSADALRVKRREAIAQLDALLQSTFLEMFGDPVKNPEEWEIKKLIELCNPDRGISYGVVQRGEHVSEGIPLIRIRDILDGKVSCDGLIQCSKEITSKYQRTVLNGGELVISIRGTVGRVAVVPVRLNGGNITRELALIPLKDGVVRPFVLELLRTESVFRKLAEDVRGVAQKGINLRDLRNLAVIQPPLDIQKKFEKAVNSIEQQKTQQRQYLAELDTLFASLQSRAFNGEL